MRICKKINLALFLLLLSSCTLTKAMWHQSYEENFTEYLASENGDYVAFVGKEYNYVFEDKLGVMRELLKYHEKNIAYIDAGKTYIYVDSNNNISGHTIIKSFGGTISKQDEVKLLAMGFSADKCDDGLCRKIPLKGHRYQNSQIDFGENRGHLERFYIFPVYYPPSTGAIVARTIATPFTIVIDAIWDVGKVIAYPFSS